MLISADEGSKTASPASAASIRMTPTTSPEAMAFRARMKCSCQPVHSRVYQFHVLRQPRGFWRDLFLPSGQALGEFCLRSEERRVGEEESERGDEWLDR